jgi:thiol-disulfide isomerase/thioredoxin
MLQRFLVVVATAALSCFAWALPLPGDAAPPLSLTEITNAPEGTPKTLEELKGKIVVLEFWATWCGPCIAAIPHLNELVEHYADAEDVAFLSITKESPAIVSPFLDKRAMSSPIGHDGEGLTLDAYGIKFLPTTIVIGKDGKIAAVTSPMELTVERIERFRRGDRDDASTFAPAVERMVRNSLEVLSKEVTSWSPGIDPFSRLENTSPEFQVILRENPYITERAGTSGAGVTILGAHPRKIFSVLAGVREACVFLPDSIANSDKRYDLIVSWPGGKEPSEEIRDTAVRLAAASLGCSITFATEDVEGYRIIRHADTPLPDVAERNAGWTYTDTSFEAPEGAFIAAFMGVLEHLTGKVYSNGLGSWEIYRMPRIEFEAGDIDSINRAMQDNYGMQLEPYTIRNMRVARLTPLPD